MQHSPIGRVGSWAVCQIQSEEYKKIRSVGVAIAFTYPGASSVVFVTKACCSSPKETDFLFNTKMSLLWKGEVILCSVWEKPFLSSDTVTASCLGAGILTLFLPLIKQQLPTDSFHLCVALVYKLFISLTFCPPSAFCPLCTAVCSSWLLGQ